jgi:hypothetical protein
VGLQQVVLAVAERLVGLRHGLMHLLLLRWRQPDPDVSRVHFEQRRPEGHADLDLRFEHDLLLARLLDTGRRHQSRDDARFRVTGRNQEIVVGNRATQEFVRSANAVEHQAVVRLGAPDHERDASAWAHHARCLGQCARRINAYIRP